MSLASAQKAAAIIRDAGGRIVGRTRLQKIAYLLTAAGLEDGFRFVYKHYGPYSEQLASGALYANLLDLVKETENHASWGGTYSIYSVAEHPPFDVDTSRLSLAKEAVTADAVELELAATAVFLAIEGFKDPWIETARRKPDKSESGRIEKAKALYSRLALIDTPSSLPSI